MQNSELRLAVDHAPEDIKRCAALIVQERKQRELQAVAVALYRSPAFQRLLTVERNKQRQPAYASGGMLYRNAGQPDLRQMQAELSRMQRRGAELERRVHGKQR